MDRDSTHRITELLCSHLCHELISPVTAVNNGLELMGAGGGVDAEAIELTRHSAAEASRRLQFYRLAYGQAAGFDAARGLADARDLSKGLMAGSKIALEWADADAAGAEIGKAGVKLLVNLVALAREALPRGGTIKVAVGGPPKLACTVAAKGAGARLTDEIKAAMAEGAAVEELTPRTVHAYLVAAGARRLGAGLGIDFETADRVVFRVSLGGSES